MLRKYEIVAVPHGFRSSLCDRTAKETNHPREVIKAALAHVIQNRVETAYRRTDLFERRRILMKDWATYLSGERKLAVPRPGDEFKRPVRCWEPLEKQWFSRGAKIFYPKGTQDYQGFGSGQKREWPDFTPKVGREGAGPIEGGGEEANRGQPQPLPAQGQFLFGAW